MKIASCGPWEVTGYLFCFLILLCLAFSALPLGYPLVGHGRALRHPLYVGDFAEAMLRLVGLNADLVAGRTFDLFG